MSQPEQAQSKRLFIALWPGEEVTRKIKQHALKHFSECKGRVLDKHNWHITLAYFGAADSNTQECIESQLSNIKAHEFELALSVCGYWKKPAVAWLAPNSIPEALKSLAFDVQQSLIACGYQPEQRDYKPHVTLVRKARTSPAVSEIQEINWTVKSFSLVESKISVGGAQYKVIKSWNVGWGEELNPNRCD